MYKWIYVFKCVSQDTYIQDLKSQSIEQHRLEKGIVKKKKSKKVI